MTLAVAVLAGCTTQLTKAPSLPPPSATGGRSANAAVDADRQQKVFESWVTNFRTRARTAGIDEATLNVAFADVRYLPRVGELDRAQPEFTTRTVWSYLDSAVSPQRVALGQDKWLQFRAETDAAAARYGARRLRAREFFGYADGIGSAMCPSFARELEDSNRTDFRSSERRRIH